MTGVDLLTISFSFWLIYQILATFQITSSTRDPQRLQSSLISVLTFLFVDGDASHSAIHY